MIKRSRSLRHKLLIPLISILLFCGCFIRVSAASPAVPEGAVLPAWYSFPEDSLSLLNESQSIDRQYYVDVFGPLKGSVLYDLFEANGSHGLCYGVSFVEGSLLADDPSLDSFHTPGGGNYDSIGQLKKGSVSESVMIPLLGLVKYAYVTQASSAVAVNYNKTKNDPEGLRSAVYDFVYHGGPPVAVGLLGNYASHEVLAVGLLGDEDILISDSNDPSRLYVMDFTGSDWQYRCGGYNWRSHDAEFDYCTDILSVMEGIHGGGEERIISDPEYTYSETEENEAFTDINCPGYVCLDTDQMLLLIPDGFDYTPKEIVKRVSTGDSSYLDVDYEFDYCWANADQAVLMRNESGEPRMLALFGNQSGLAASVQPDNIVAVTDVEDAPSLLLKGKDGQEVLFAGVLPTGRNDEAEFLIISGAVDGDEVFAVLAKNTIYVSGLRDVTATVEIPGGVQTESVQSSGGEMLVGGDFASGVRLTLLGDADGDGRVTSSDARIALRCSVKLENVDDYDSLACDYDMDDSVTSADARLILRRSVGLRD